MQSNPQVLQAYNMKVIMFSFSSNSLRNLEDVFRSLSENSNITFLLIDSLQVEGLLSEP